MRKLVDRIFRFERIDGRCATDRYLHRWTLLRLPGGRGLYLHHFVGSDWARDLHDHPKTFLSIGLRGGYVEERLDVSPLLWTRANVRIRRQFRAPWIRYWGPRHTHRLRVPPHGCWTLVFVGLHRREWGFVRRGRWIHWIDYVQTWGGKGGC